MKRECKERRRKGQMNWERQSETDVAKEEETGTGVKEEEERE